MPPIMRSGRRGRRGGDTSDPPQVQVQAEAIQEEAVVVPAVQHNVQAVVVPQPIVPIHAPPNMDQVIEYSKVVDVSLKLAYCIQELRA